MNPCETCRFFTPHVHDAPLGWCCRYAPRPIVAGDDLPDRMAVWPLVDPTDACGEHEARD